VKEGKKGRKGGGKGKPSGTLGDKRKTGEIV